MAARLVPEVAVVGGGFAGLSCALNLCKRGVRVTLIEQGRGLGGRVCSRRAKEASGSNLTFDHGCQYLSPKAPAFQSLVQQLHSEGLLQLWGQDGSVGDVSAAGPSGRLDPASFVPYPASKQLWVGTPSNSTVGKRLAAMCGEGLQVVAATRAEQLVREPSGRWQLRLQCRSSEQAQLAAAAAAEGHSFSAVVTAMSANSTARLLQGVSPAISAAAAGVRSDVCWALLLATRRRLPLAFNGALVTGGSSAIAWLARDCSKPGRAAPAGGAGDTWVVHASPDWSNKRRDLPREQVAQQLLQELCTAAGVQLGEQDMLYCEAHRWNNAFPLNPRSPEQVAGLPQLAGHFMLDAAQALVACGDWCTGPRAGDAFLSGQEAAEALLTII